MQQPIRFSIFNKSRKYLTNIKIVIVKKTAKQFFFMTAITLISLDVVSQVLVKFKNGNLVQATYINISMQDVVYKKAGNDNYLTCRKRDVACIQYPSGEKY